MYFATYIHEGMEKIGLVNSQQTKVLDLSKVSGFQDFEQMIDLIRGWNDELNAELKEVANDTELWQKESLDISDIKLRAPIPRLNRDVLCLGLNYKDHVAESQSALSLKIDLPEFPVYFSKRASRAIGHGEGINSHSDITQEVDYEVELAIVIGKGGTNIKAGEALDHVFGYTILNDVTARDIQRRHIQWMKGKSLDTFTVIGPWIVHKEAIPFPVELEIYSKVNGEMRQHSNTRNFIFHIPHVISELSKGMTLEPGDIIATGTPAGVGMGFKPPKYLKAGDVVECYIEKIGNLVNPIV